MVNLQAGLTPGSVFGGYRIESFVARGGQLPFDRPTNIAKMWAHLNDPPPSAAAVSPAVSAALDAVIRRELAKAPEERYSSSGEFARAARAAAAPIIPGQPARPEFEVTQIDPTLVGPAPGAVPQQPAPEAVPQQPATDRPRTGRTEARSALGRGPAVVASALAVLVIGVAIAFLSAGGGGKSSSAAAGSQTGHSTAAVASPASAAPLTTVAATPSTTTTSPAATQAAAYHAQVNRIIPRLHAVFQRFPKGGDFGKSVFSRSALSVAAGLRGIADDLDALSPPSNILIDHEALVTHLHEMEQAFRSLAADSDNRNFSGAQRDLQASQVALARINAGVRRVQAAS